MVLEKVVYDHVSIMAGILCDETSGISYKIEEARKVMHAISGLGIRENIPTTFVCNIIFWSIIVPIALFGCDCELCILCNKCRNI